MIRIFMNGRSLSLGTSLSPYPPSVIHPLAIPLNPVSFLSHFLFTLFNTIPHGLPSLIPKTFFLTNTSPENTLYEGGLFKAHLTFPVDYPLQPPKMTFKTEIWHPNVYPSGLVCISILHPPEEDKYGYEDAGERWMPVHTPQTILLSVISMV